MMATSKKKAVQKPMSKKAVKKVAVTSTEKTPASQSTAKKLAPAKDGDGPVSMVGKKAPRFRLLDQAGRAVSSDDFKGKAYVLYFYPKDNTPGCTKESCDFRDGLRNFQRSGVTILGVSPDSEKSHAGFAEKFNLPFSLLSDPEKKLAESYGVWALKQNYGREYFGIVRSTFLIDKSGKVKKEWRGVKVEGHAAKVLEEARA